MLASLKVLGTTRVQTKLTRVSDAVTYSKPAMELIATEILRIEEQTFASEGRRGGGSWRKVTDQWFQRKAIGGLDLRTGHATLALRKAMSVRGAEYQELEVTEHTVSLGTSLPYADTQQRHRPFVKITARDRARIRGIFRDYVIGAWEARA